jgi:putative Holliday junction resolvase
MTAESCSTSDQQPLTGAAQDTFSLPLLALDIGGKRIGVAVSDRLGIGCRGITCLHRNDRGWPKQVAKLVREYGIRGIVVGLARNMDGSEGPQAADCRAAAAQLAEVVTLPQRFWDERLSTWTAKERLYAQGLNEKKVRERLDQTAAAVILEDFIAAHPELKHA